MKFIKSCLTYFYFVLKNLLFKKSFSGNAKCCENNLNLYFLLVEHTFHTNFFHITLYYVFTFVFLKSKKCY